MSTAAIVVALISGGISLAAAAASFMSSRSVARLNSQLEEQRSARSKKEQAAAVRARYRDPLLSAVFDLQSRIWNIVENTFLVRYLKEDDERGRAYAVENTLHVLAEYLGWVEILRREVQFLDLGEEAADREWAPKLERVRDVLADDEIDPVFRLFRGEQRAIGELMTLSTTDPDGGRPHQCLGFAKFATCRREPDFGRWFEKLEADLHLLAKEPHDHHGRLLLLHDALIDLLDILDRECKRFPPKRRERIPQQRVG